MTPPSLLLRGALLNGLKIRELVLNSTTAARAEAQRLTFRDRSRDIGGADLECFAHEMRNALTAALLAFEIVSTQNVGPETRALVTLRRNLLRMRVLFEPCVPEASGEA
jgi:hypothetical protein